MKMKQTYVKDWDFDTVWGIDKNINNGYPYLLWEYPDVEEENPYTVNSVKLTDLLGNELEEIPTKSFYFVDGGMTDNIRPALYQAKYDCDVVGKQNEPKTKKVTIAGKCCESGDLIIEDVMLPDAKTGDRIVVYTTGAYGYSMSSNYNKATTPAVVFVKDGQSRLVVKRQTYADLVANDTNDDWSQL